MPPKPRSKSTEPISCIYQIKNLVNKKLYIGSAKNFHIRKLKHINYLINGKHGNYHLQNAWLLYGNQNFEFSILEDCDIKNLIIREQFWLDRLKPEYNLSPTAGNTLGTKRTKEQKLKISASQKGIKRSELARYNMAQCKIGKIYSEEARTNMKKHSGTRNLKEWPCIEGSKCKCETCITKRKERNNLYKRKAYHAKTRYVY